MQLSKEGIQEFVNEHKKSVNIRVNSLIEGWSFEGMIETKDSIYGSIWVVPYIVLEQSFSPENHVLNIIDEFEEQFNKKINS